MNARRWAIVGMLLAPLALVAAVCGDTTTRIENPGAGQQTGITVGGEGTAQGKPDVALITLGVTALAPTVGEARDRAAASLDAMLKSVKSGGVAEKDIQTTQLSINPEYNYDNGNQTLRGFRVTNTVSIKVREINKTGDVVDGAVTAGGNDTTIQGITFTIDDPEQLREKAREAAVADARRRAETLAKASGVSVGSPISITETSYNPPIYSARDALAPSTGGEVATPIQPGELDVVISVSVTFEIK